MIKKLGFTRAEFDAYLAAPPVPHTAYPSETVFYGWLYVTIRRVRMAFGGRKFNENF